MHHRLHILLELLEFSDIKISIILVKMFLTENNSSEKNNDQLKNEQARSDRKPVSVSDLLYAAYFVPVIAAIFVVNAMEDGRYRNPLAGGCRGFGCRLAILAYSFVKAAKEDWQEG